MGGDRGVLKLPSSTPTLSGQFICWCESLPLQSDPFSFTICLFCFPHGSLREGPQACWGKWACSGRCMDTYRLSPPLLLTLCCLPYLQRDLRLARRFLSSELLEFSLQLTFSCAVVSGNLHWMLWRGTVLTSEAGGFSVLACEGNTWEMRCCGNKESCHSQCLLWVLQIVCFIRSLDCCIFAFMETKEWACFGGPQPGCVVGEKLISCGFFVGLCSPQVAGREQRSRFTMRMRVGDWTPLEQVCSVSSECQVKELCLKMPKSCQWHQAERQVFSCRIFLFHPHTSLQLAG